MAKFNQTMVSEWQDAAIVLAGGALAGAGCYELNKYAATVNATTGKQNIGFLATSPYITGFAVAALGFGLLFVKQDMVQQLGLGLIAGGTAEGTAELVHYFSTKSTSTSTSTSAQ